MNADERKVVLKKCLMMDDMKFFLDILRWDFKVAYIILEKKELSPFFLKREKKEVIKCN